MNAVLERASQSGPQDQFAPLAESLIWLVMINDAFWDHDKDSYRKESDSDPLGITIEDLRYARHRHVHDIRVYGLHGAMAYIGGYADGYGRLT